MLDPETKENIACALWMHEYMPDEVSQTIKKLLEGQKNLSSAFGKRMQVRIADLSAAPESFNPDYTKRYAALSTYAGELTPHQAYAMTNLFGMDRARGYQELPIDKKFTFPTDDRPQFEYQVGWHFFVGNVFDTKGREYGVQLMFWRYSLLPPKMAKEAGLSDLENQIVEVHLAVSAAGGRHYRMRPVIISGTTGLSIFRPSHTHILLEKTLSLLDQRILSSPSDCRHGGSTTTRRSLPRSRSISPSFRRNAMS